MIYWQMKSSETDKRNRDYEKIGFLILMLIMAVYYIYRMFALTPWYDELYTYYYFISRGPVYAAIHWPVPNNHVGYSVLSGFLDYIGNPYLGLRGISFLCALANMALLFKIGRCWLNKGLSLAAVILYVSMGLVNHLAVQGRGYTLGVTCFLTAFYCLIQICGEEKCKEWYYYLFMFSLVLGLYTLTSDVYWVLPICFTGGFYLLYKGILEAGEENRKIQECKSIRKLVKLILFSVAAAFITIILYAIIWLAIGSNLLVKDENSIYFGMGHVQLILKAPFKALFSGIDYMLSTPYIQSVEREGFLARLIDWLKLLLNWYYDGFWAVIAGIVALGIICLVITIVFGIRKRENILLPLFLFNGIICLPLFLTIQCALPYYRVFLYGGVLLALLTAFLVQFLLKRLTLQNSSDNGIGKKIASVFLFAVILFAVSRFGWKGYQDQYGMREYYIQDALINSHIEQMGNLCVTDCTQQYLMKFLYDITCENTQIEGTNLLLLDRKMTDPDYNEMEWEFYHYYHTIPWEYVNNNMEQIYENEDFVLYEKRRG